MGRHRNLLRTWRRRDPRLGTVAPAELGVHPAVTGADAHYVDRADDAAVEALVGGDARVVVVAGPRLAGSTRSLARAARLLLGDHHVVRPDEVVTTDLRAVLAALPARRPTVLWLDDAHLGLLAQLDDALLAGIPDGVRLLVSTRAELLAPDVLEPGLLEHPGVVAIVDARDACAPDRATPPGDAAPAGDLPEAEVPGPAGADLDRTVSGTLPGTRYVDLDAARSALLLGAGARDVRRAAVLRAAADWDRLQVPEALSRSTLAHLAVGYAQVVPGGEGPTSETLARTVDALCTERHPMLRRRVRDDRVHHAADPLLAVAADQLDTTAARWTPPPRLAEVLVQRLPPGGLRRGVGVLAHHRRFADLALELLAGSSVSVATAYFVGFSALESDRRDDAHRWFAAVVAGGDAEFRPRAAFWLALTGGDVEEERHHLRLVVDEGVPDDRSDAALRLGLLERGEGRPAEARRWLRTAARHDPAVGRPHRVEASFELALLDRDTGHLDAARQEFAGIVAAGDPEFAPRAALALAALARPTSSGPASSGPTSSGPTSSGPTSSGPASSGPASSGPEPSDPESSAPAPAPRRPVDDRSAEDHDDRPSPEHAVPPPREGADEAPVSPGPVTAGRDGHATS